MIVATHEHQRRPQRPIGITRAAIASKVSTSPSLMSIRFGSRNRSINQLRTPVGRIEREDVEEQRDGEHDASRATLAANQRRAAQSRP